MAAHPCYRINLGTFIDVAPNPLPDIHPFLPNYDSDFDAGCLALLRLYETQEKRRLGQQISKCQRSRARLTEIRLLAAFFPPGPLRPHDPWKRCSLSEFPRNERQAGQRWYLLGCQEPGGGTASVLKALGPPSASEGLRRSQNHLLALATSQPAWEPRERGAQARASRLPSLRTGGDVGDVVVTSLPRV